MRGANQFMRASECPGYPVSESRQRILHVVEEPSDDARPAIAALPLIQSCVSVNPTAVFYRPVQLPVIVDSWIGVLSLDPNGFLELNKWPIRELPVELDGGIPAPTDLISTEIRR